MTFEESVFVCLYWLVLYFFKKMIKKRTFFKKVSKRASLANINVNLLFLIATGEQEATTNATNTSPSSSYCIQGTTWTNIFIILAIIANQE